MTATTSPAIASATAPFAPRLRRGVLLLVSALIAALLVPLALDTSQAEARSNMSTEASYAVLTLINAERHVHGLPSLRMNYDLVSSARRHDLHMGAADSLSHQLRGEVRFTRRMSISGYRWSWAGENIAWNSQMNRIGALDLETSMYRERAPYNEHRLNILNRRFTDVGIDVFFDFPHHKIWLTTDFGRGFRR